jgi:hypothetical protein
LASPAKDSWRNSQQPLQYYQLKIPFSFYSFLCFACTKIKLKNETLFGFETCDQRPKSITQKGMANF